VQESLSGGSRRSAEKVHDGMRRAEETDEADMQLENGAMTSTGGTRDGSGRIVYDPFDAATMRDPYPIYRALRAERPVYYNPERDFYALSRFDDIFRALRDPATFSSAEGLTPTKGEKEMLGLAPTFIMMDPPDHTRLRRLVSKALTRDRVTEMERDIRDFVRGRLDRVVAAAARDGAADIVHHLTSPLPTYLLAELLGVPENDRERFDPWSQALTSANLDDQASVDAAIVAVAQLFQFFIGLIERRRKETSDDMLGSLVESQREGEPLTNWDILGFCFVFIAGGNDTTNHLLANGLTLLHENPPQRQRLIDDRSLIPNAVEEMLRIEAPVQGLSRALTRDMELHGVHIPKGAKVHMLFASGNRDERVFGPASESFDVGRNVERHLSFSQGPHFCIGAHLGRMMARVALEEILDRMPSYELPLEGRQRTHSPFVRGFEVLPFSPG
jgi:cytochrome P450 family 130